MSYAHTYMSVPKVHTHTHICHTHTHICLFLRYIHTHIYVIRTHIYVCQLGADQLQGGDDAWDALSCRSLSAKEPLIMGPFCGKRPIKIRHPRRLCHPVCSVCRFFFPLQHTATRCSVLQREYALVTLNPKFSL